MEQIISDLANKLGSRTAAVEHVAKLLNRSPFTVWGWVSGKPMPDNQLRLLKLLIEQG